MNRRAETATTGKMPVPRWPHNHRPTQRGYHFGLSALLALTLLVTLAWGVLAQEGEVPIILHAAIDRDPITVGDQVIYTLQVDHPADVDINFPNLPPEWGTVEVLGQQPESQEVTTDDLIQASKQYTITTFSVGEHGIQPLPIDYFLPDGQRGTLHTDPITLTVNSVVTDTALLAEMDIHGLKPQVGLVRDWTGWVLMGAGIFVVLLALVILALWLLVWRKRRAEGEQIVIDNRLPEEIAYDELDHIQGLSLPERNRMKEHYTLVTGCMRQYAERIYGIPAMDRTTAEFTTAMRKARVSREHVDLFNNLFLESDLVKFAKLIPDVREAEQSVSQAHHIVDVTKPERVVEEKEAEDEVEDKDQNAVLASGNPETAES